MLMSRSRNSHIRSPRSVTIVAIGIPFLTLNAAIDFFARGDAPLDLLAGVRLRVALDHVHAFDHEPVRVGQDLQHAAALAAILAGHHEHVVVLPKRCCETTHYRTSGASEIIFMKRRSRSSRATGPNTRVPIGSP